MANDHAFPFIRDTSRRPPEPLDNRINLHLFCVAFVLDASWRAYLMGAYFTFLPTVAFCVCPSTLLILLFVLSSFRSLLGVYWVVKLCGVFFWSLNLFLVDVVFRHLRPTASGLFAVLLTFPWRLFQLFSHFICFAVVVRVFRRRSSILRKNGSVSHSEDAQGDEDVDAFPPGFFRPRGDSTEVQSLSLAPAINIDDLCQISDLQRSLIGSRMMP